MDKGPSSASPCQLFWPYTVVLSDARLFVRRPLLMSGARQRPKSGLDAAVAGLIAGDAAGGEEDLDRYVADLLLREAQQSENPREAGTR